MGSAKAGPLACSISFLEEVAIGELLVGILLRGKKLDGKAIDLEIAYRGRATARVGQVDAESVVRG